MLYIYKRYICVDFFILKEEKKKEELTTEIFRTQRVYTITNRQIWRCTETSVMKIAKKKTIFYVLFTTSQVFFGY